MMRRLALAVLLASACVRAPAGPALVDDGPASPTAKKGAPLPQALPISLRTYPANSVWHLADERGHVVLLDVWATWCDPCRDSLPLYDDLAKEFAHRGLRVYAINVDATQKPIAPFLAELKLSLPVLLDPEAAMSESTLKVKMMPTSFLIDKNGVIRHMHEGFDESLLSTYLEEISALLEEPAAPAP